MSAHEVRLTPAYANANPVTYQIAADPSVNSGACTSADCTGTLTQGGSDFAYIYQGQSIYMHGASSVHTEYTGMTGYPATLNQTQDLGYKIFKNATQQASGISGTASPLVAGAYPTGWADVSDTTGRGIEIGVRFMAAFFNKSLEFTNGGANVAIGLWPSENGNPTGGPGNGTVFHYQPWQERAVFDFFLNFHTTALLGQLQQTLFSPGSTRWSAMQVGSMSTPRTPWAATIRFR